MTASGSAAGRVVAVCLGPGGLPKHPVPSAEVGELGLAGDGHRFARHGGVDRAVCLFSVEDYRSLRADGVAAEPPGAFGENLLTEGIDYTRVRAGDRLEVGAELVLEVFDVREPCAGLRELDRRFPDLMVGRSGFVCRVAAAGTVAPGTAIVHVPA